MVKNLEMYLISTELKNADFVNVLAVSKLLFNDFGDAKNIEIL